MEKRQGIWGEEFENLQQELTGAVERMARRFAMLRYSVVPVSDPLDEHDLHVAMIDEWTLVDITSCLSEIVDIMEYHFEDYSRDSLTSEVMDADWLCDVEDYASKTRRGAMYKDMEERKTAAADQAK